MPKSIDKATYDLSVKNPNKADEAALRDPKEIIAEMAALDAESAEILAEHRGDAVKRGWNSRRFGEVCDVMHGRTPAKRALEGRRHHSWQ